MTPICQPYSLMADFQLEVVGVRTNIDKLSVRAVHNAFENIVRNEALMGDVALKAFVPKREMDMARSAGHTGPVDDGVDITAHVGIPEIHKPGESSPTSALYPIFVDKGTGVFGETGQSIFPKEKDFMRIPPERGYPGFLPSSKGQPGRHFMAATFAVMVAALRINGEVFRKELTEKLRAERIS